MATYFHGNSEMQAPDGGLQTLVLMNPSYIQYSDTPPPPHHPNNLVFLNNSISPQTLHHAPPPHTQQFVGIPLPSSSDHPMHPHHHDVSALHGFMPRMQYNLWNNTSTTPPASDTPRAQQGLSLSLSNSQQAQAGMGSSSQALHAPAMSGDDVRGSSSSASASAVTTTNNNNNNNNNGVSGGIQSVLLGSKYLKAAQELLDEVVNVNDGIKNEIAKKSNGLSKTTKESPMAVSGDGSPAGETAAKATSELSTAEKQDIQMKKAKLISMLDEVEQRYRQYHHQMQIVSSSFEQAAGIGSARTYTALALQTISKQFRCLKDAIMGQIRAANKSLGEEDGFGTKMEGSRLKYVDHHLRQQRALQQLGMIQHNAWRPQRGLPERSVSVLRAWLFEHFLHPYPKDSDKIMLAKQTGLTRSQVSNWFINARVRLWKPMVEEMYMEEMKEHEQNGGGGDEKSSKSGDDLSAMASPQDISPASATEHKSLSFKQDGSTNPNTPTVSVSPPSTSPVGGHNARNHTGFCFMGTSELDGIAQPSPKKPRNHEILQSHINVDMKSDDAGNGQMSMKFGDERQSRDGYCFMGNQTNFIGGFGQYPIAEIDRFEAEQFTPRFSGNNGVSLTLGLPHCDSLSAATHQTFLPNQSIQLGRRMELGEPNEFGGINTSNALSSAAFENINMQNPKKFAAQLLPDFVA